jgi:hypothetical protein
MTHDPAAPPRRARRRWWMLGALAAVLIVIVATAAWVGVRALAARDALEAATEHARALQDDALGGDVAAIDAHAEALAADAAEAARLTSDPVWRASELVPWFGRNLAAVREVTTIVDDLAQHGMAPLLDAASTIDVETLGVQGDSIDVAPLREVAPALAEADAVFSRAQADAAAIDTAGILPLISDAVHEFRDTLSPAAAAVDGLARASAILPGMLGADGPRTYLLLMQNNAEVRSSGGVPGAMALIRADQGRITLERQASTAEFRRSEEPIQPLAPEVIALFDQLPGQYIQNSVMIPDFPDAAALAAAHWDANIGGTPVDGVIAVDTVTIADILAATGTLDLGPYELTAENAPDILLSQVYRDVTSPSGQDAVFEAAASGMFAAVTDGRASASQLMGALGQAAAEGRVRLWSRDPAEQEALAETTLAGSLPTDDASTIHAGVFFNDTTGAKMNYYSDAEVTTELTRCGDASTMSVTVTWTNGAPADAATALPVYVTGGGHAGVDPGSTRTRIAVYGPEGWLARDSSVDGESAGAQTALDKDRPVIQHEVTLAPGAQTRIVVEFIGEAGEAESALVTTPLLRPIEVDESTGICARE